jgi:3-oxoadipate enol-lactonase
MVLAHEIAGTGPVVVLLHSGICDRRQWDAQWDALASLFTVVRADLRGFGESQLVGGRYSDADDVAELAHIVSANDIAIVGSSYGGRVALEIAVTYPHLVRQLVLLCPAFRGLESTAAADAFDAEEERLLDGGDIDGAVELNVRTWLGPLAPDRVRDKVRGMQRNTLEVQLAADRLADRPQLLPVPVDPSDIRCPTMLVSGGQDVDHFQNVARYLSESVAGAQLVEWSDVAHLPNLEVPDRTTALLVSVLA